MSPRRTVRRTPGEGPPSEAEGPAEGTVPRKQLSLFEGYGIEIESIIVDSETLDVKPVADQLLTAAGAGKDHEVVRGDIGWSNELALHVIEFKTDGPVDSLNKVADRFKKEMVHANKLLAEEGAALLPGGMHPWMNPETEFRIWPHEYTEVYQAFDRIFGCKGHGWSNLQSTHLNLPYKGPEEFALLHEAIRLTLPLLPAISASSPIVERNATGWISSRMHIYASNAEAVPLVTGQVVPEAVLSPDDYRDRILRPLYRSLEPHDPEGVLRYEWVNARGAIARFQRGAIEIRVLDTQETPAADFAVLSAVIAVVEHVVELLRDDPEAGRTIETRALSGFFMDVARRGRAVKLEGSTVLRLAALLGAPEARTVGDIWAELHDTLKMKDKMLAKIIDSGTLSERLLVALGSRAGKKLEFEPEPLREVYQELMECPTSGKMFRV